MISKFRLFFKQCYRETLLHVRQPQLLAYGALFFLMVAVFFPLTMPPSLNLLRNFAPGLIWIALLLALLLTTVNFFQQDYEDGILEQWLVSAYSLNIIIAAKMFVHWLINLLALLIFCPFLALLFNLSRQELGVLMLSFILGTPTLLFLCGFAAAFSNHRQPKGLLMALILLPLTIPVMIFGSSTLFAMMHGLAVSAYLAILLACSLLAVGFLPFAIAAVIRVTFV